MNSKVIFSNPNMIEVNGVCLEVFEAGQENKGNPIILCHGWPQHAYAWRYQIDSLVQEGYHLIIPNQRGYGKSSSPDAVELFDIEHLAGDLVGLLDHYGYEKATFIGHDWGATVVWGLAQLYPNRVDKIINLSVPYLDRGDRPWLEVLEGFFGSDYYMVHFNKKPGVADAVLNQHTHQFLRNLYRKNEVNAAPEPGMLFINLALRSQASGDPLMSEDDLSVFVSAFESSGFTGSINWYRNLDRNWHILGKVESIIHHPALMIYGEKDPVQSSPTLSDAVPNVEVVTLPCGHWIQEEEPEKVNRAIVTWLRKRSK